MIRLIVSDLDGTLLQDHHTIHPDSLHALRDAMAQGILFAVASGRSAAVCSLLLEDHGLPEVSIIAVNGCHVMDRPFGDTLSMHFLPDGAAQASLAHLSAFGLDGCLYTAETIAYTHERMLTSRETDAFGSRMRRAGMRVTAGPHAVAEALQLPALKAFAICRPGQEPAFEAARQACAAIPGAAITSSGRDNFEVMPQGVDKATALMALTARLGIDASEVLAFGDSENDLAMLMWAGHAYAMGNARSVIKRAIPNHTGRCDEGGVGQGIRRALAR